MKDFLHVSDYSTAELQHLLLSTAFLPHVTASTAERVSGIRTASRLLLELAQRHFFTNRREHSEATFEYHALFHDFLRDGI